MPKAGPESWVCVWHPGSDSLTLSATSSSSSLLEFQGPDMLRPARPPFGFLVVAAHCAFQDFILGREEARVRRVEREIQRGYLLPSHPSTSWAVKRKVSETQRLVGGVGGCFSFSSPCRKSRKGYAALASTEASLPKGSTTGWASL